MTTPSDDQLDLVGTGTTVRSKLSCAAQRTTDTTLKPPSYTPVALYHSAGPHNLLPRKLLVQRRPWDHAAKGGSRQLWPTHVLGTVPASQRLESKIWIRCFKWTD